MIFYKRILGFLVSFLLTALLLLTYFHPQKIWYFVGISIFLILFYFWRIKNRFVDYKTIFAYFATIFLYFGFIFAFFTMINNIYIRYIFLIFALLSFITIFDSFFRKIYENHEIKKQLIIYIDLLCFWMLSYFLFYNTFFFKNSLLFNSISIVILSFLIISISFYWHQINIKANILYIVVAVFILLQIFVISSFLPFVVYLSVFILWIWYYILMDFIIDKIKDKFVFKKKIKLLFLATTILILSLITKK
ncbi:MAG: hypothetical protein PHZ07_02590 [Patescibacteria group bacterium]|nr:hypothetical protein [Patescibacteria group bacterium]MDD4304692.1 hypothetical protein [Patescibacteria group bacterium]MDD4695340.1 hypothetical protein [Patescibacteria group bacterium]